MIKRLTFISLSGILFIGFLVPEDFTNPVVGSSSKDYNKDSFWYYPWGRSITHKGVDVFAKKGNPLVSSTAGIVLYVGEIEMGGNIVVVLAPKWRLHYYAHLDSISTNSFSFVSSGHQIGTIGSSGNAKGKAPHLHYSIVTIFPYIWQIDFGKHGWKKMFYLNPITSLKNAETNT